MKTIYTLILFSFSIFSFAQNVPIDFEVGGNGLNWSWTTFENDTNPQLEIVANPDPSGINMSATVAKFTALQAGAAWAGCESMHGADIGSFSFNNSKVIAFPLSGFSTIWFEELLNENTLHNALFNSLVIAISSTILATILGTLVARASTRYIFSGKKISITFILVPLILPEIILVIDI